MRTSAQGLVAIMAYEALYLHAYDDGTGVWTIGVGHTAALGAPVPVPGMIITFDDAIALFRRDISRCEKAVTEAVHVPLTQQQFDALVSWELNCGSVRSPDTTLTRRLNAQDYGGAADQLLRWNKAKGKVLDGLKTRRSAEREMFLKGNYGSSSITFCDATGAKRAVPRDEMLAKVSAALGADDSAEHTQRDVTIDSPDELRPQEPILLPGDEAEKDYPANPASAILPRYRPRQSTADTRAALAAYRSLIPETRQHDAIVLLAVRGYYENTFGVRDGNDRGFYDDAIFVVEPNHVHNFNANTDPSIARNGIATLVAPQAVLYKPGYHGYRSAYGHEAFRQASSVKVARDGGAEQSDHGRSPFWINLHRGGNTRTSSEGCQTIPPSQWPEFKPLVDGLLRQYGQGDFYYLLITQDQLASAIAAGAVLRTRQPVETNPTSVVARHEPQILRRDDMAAPNDRVSAMQLTLKRLGYELGAVDGRFCSLTQSALLGFQADNNLPTTGELDAHTQAMLDKGPMRPLSRARTGASESDVVAAGSSTIKDAVSSRILSWITAGLGALGVGNSAVINAGTSATQPSAGLLTLLDEMSRLGTGTAAPEVLKRIAESARGFKEAAIAGAPTELVQELLALRASLPPDALAKLPELDRVLGSVARINSVRTGSAQTVFDILPTFFADGTILQTMMKGVALTASSTLPGFAGSTALLAAGLFGRHLANRIAAARVQDHRDAKNIGN